MRNLRWQVSQPHRYEPPAEFSDSAAAAASLRARFLASSASNSACFSPWANGQPPILFMVGIFSTVPQVLNHVAAFWTGIKINIIIIFG